jgi:hypothetical protein
MYQHRIPTSDSPRVEVTACQGDLAVMTWDSSEVLVEIEAEEALTVEEREDTGRQGRLSPDCARQRFPGRRPGTG